MNIPYGPILIVEDTPNLLELLEVTLRFKGYPVIGAVNGLEALEMVRVNHPALIITDILMPKMDGYELVYELRKNPLTSQIPVIFISATYLTKEDKSFALNLGGVRFIEKPIDTEDLLLTVAEILTQGISSPTELMAEQEFYQGYRERLENKLSHKNSQIIRTERLLETLPDTQKPAFQALLAQVIEDRDKIQDELDDLFRTLEKLNQTGKVDASPQESV